MVVPESGSDSCKPRFAWWASPFLSSLREKNCRVLCYVQIKWKMPFRIVESRGASTNLKLITLTQIIKRVIRKTQFACPRRKVNNFTIISLEIKHWSKLARLLAWTGYAKLNSHLEQALTHSPGWDVSQWSIASQESTHYLCREKRNTNNLYRSEKNWAMLFCLPGSQVYRLHIRSRLNRNYCLFLPNQRSARPMHNWKGMWKSPFLVGLLSRQQWERHTRSCFGLIGKRKLEKPKLRMRLEMERSHLKCKVRGFLNRLCMRDRKRGCL